MKVTILDTKTGETRTSTGEKVFWWTEGNGSCDCNRESLFGYDTSDNTCIGSYRFLIIAAELEPADGPCELPTLHRLNQDYPEELLEKHLSMNPTPAIQEAAKLHDSFNDALLGATVSIHGADRFCYSLRKIIRIVMMQRQCKASEAREIVAAELVIPILREHGPDGPVFVNDELVEGEIPDEEKPCIITPPGFNGKIVTP